MRWWDNLSIHHEKSRFLATNIYLYAEWHTGLSAWIISFRVTAFNVMTKMGWCRSFLSHGICLSSRRMHACSCYIGENGIDYLKRVCESSAGSLSIPSSELIKHLNESLSASGWLVVDDGIGRVRSIVSLCDTRDCLLGLFKKTSCFNLADCIKVKFPNTRVSAVRNMHWRKPVKRGPLTMT